MSLGWLSFSKSMVFLVMWHLCATGESPAPQGQLSTVDAEPCGEPFMALTSFSIGKAKCTSSQEHYKSQEEIAL